MKTLIVEDDFASRLLLQTCLARYGECHIAVNGVEAVSAFRVGTEAKQPYDLICMDIMMPEMDGQAALASIRALEEEAEVPWSNRVRIVMTTALQDIKQVMSSFRGLCDAYVCKPVDLGLLLEQLKSLELPV
jgi:two-component system chemotaxis response regulator CheY